MQDDLGDWIKWRLWQGVQGQGKLAKDQLEDCVVDTQELEKQWASQKASQLSLHTRMCPFFFFEKLLTYIKLDAPTRLKKELDTVLALQANIDTTD